MWPLTPLSFCRCTPSPSLLKRLQDIGPGGGEATGRHAPSLDTTPAVHEPLRPLIFHRCFPSHLQPHRTTVSACTCYPRAATHALFWATTSSGSLLLLLLSMGLQPCACRRPARRARPTCMFACLHAASIQIKACPPTLSSTPCPSVKLIPFSYSLDFLVVPSSFLFLSFSVSLSVFLSLLWARFSNPLSSKAFLVSGFCCFCVCVCLLFRRPSRVKENTRKGGKLYDTKEPPTSLDPNTPSTSPSPHHTSTHYYNHITHPRRVIPIHTNQDARFVNRLLSTLCSGLRRPRLPRPQPQGRPAK